MSNTHGGARAGAGRKPKAEKYEPQITAAEDRLAGRLLTRLQTLEDLADGGKKKVTRKYEPAGLIFVDGILRDDDKKPYLQPSGEPIRCKVRAFPDLDAKKMVCVEEAVETLAPDRAAGIYLADRILGKPTQAVEAEIKSDLGDVFLDVFGGALTKIYGDLKVEGDPDNAGPSGDDTTTASG